MKIDHTTRRINPNPFNDPFFIGFDSILNKMSHINKSHTTNYPPYNIVKTGDNRYDVEIAVAGFEQDEISITVEEGVMTVTGSSKIDDDEFHYIHKGIATRDFTRTFTLADTVEVRGAEMHSGILSIVLENVIPEHKKPRTIAIGTGEAQLLTEDK